MCVCLCLHECQSECTFVCVRIVTRADIARIHVSIWLLRVYCGVYMSDFAVAVLSTATNPWLQVSLGNNSRGGDMFAQTFLTPLLNQVFRNWTHLAFTYDGNARQYSVYQNGVISAVVMAKADPGTNRGLPFQKAINWPYQNTAETWPKVNHIPDPKQSWPCSATTSTT